jgi:hypothetical protein
LSQQPQLTAAQVRHIKQLIASLADLDKPDYGLSSTLCGSTFSPIAGQDHVEMLLLTDHGFSQSPALKEVVALGPDALPFLLDSLDDKTPTKLTITNRVGIGGMWFEQTIQINPVDPAEVGRADAATNGASQPNANDLFRSSVDSYTVKIGDVCFVAIGQIVGRDYEAARYQPTGCVVLTSPTNDPALCARVRAIWKSNDPRRRLLDSLCTDYATVGIFNGSSLDGWEVGSNLQCGAALRMLFYFPKETDTLLARRLEQLKLGHDPQADDTMELCVKNGVRSDEFIKSVAWSSDPTIRAALALRHRQ